MNTAPIIGPNAPSPQPPVPSSAPSSGFSDLLASNLASGAALPLTTPPLGIDPTSAQPAPPPSKDTTDTSGNGNATVAVPVPVPLPHQQSASTPSGGNGSTDANSATTQGGSAPAQPTAAPTSGAAGNGTGTNGQGANGAPLPPGAAQLNARIAAGAQSLVSQPATNLGSLAHGAQTVPATAATPATPQTAAPAAPAAPTAHGTTTPDPNAALKTEAGATPTTAAAAAAAEQNTAQATVQSETLAAQRSNSGGDQSSSDPTASAQPSDPSAGTPVALPAAAAPATAFAAPTPAQNATMSTLAASTLDQIAFNLRQSARNGLNQIEIQLKPASLGSIDVKLEVNHDGRMTAVISSDRSDTLNLLQRNSGELQQALRDAGLQTDTGSLSFNLRGEQQSGGGAGQQTGYASPSTSSQSPSADETALPAAAMAANGAASHSGLLNIQV